MTIRKEWFLGPYTNISACLERLGKRSTHKQVMYIPGPWRPFILTFGVSGCGGSIQSACRASPPDNARYGLKNQILQVETTPTLWVYRASEPHNVALKGSQSYDYEGGVVRVGGDSTRHVLQAGPAAFKLVTSLVDAGVIMVEASTATSDLSLL